MAVSLNTNISVSTKQAKQLFGMSDKDLKLMDADKNGQITVMEFKSSGLNKYSGLREYFNKQTFGALTAPAHSEKVQKNSNPFAGNVKDNFRTNYNTGELSPRVSSDLASSQVGNVLPRLYA